MTLGDRVESDGRMSITTGYSSQLNIGSGVYFNDGAVISCLGKIDIGENTLFGPGVKIFDNNHRFSREEGVSRECTAGCITVGRSCWIASDVVLLKGTDIGDNCVIGAGCVIRGKVPAGSLVTAAGSRPPGRSRQDKASPLVKMCSSRPAGRDEHSNLKNHSAAHGQSNAEAI